MDENQQAMHNYYEAFRYVQCKIDRIAILKLQSNYYVAHESITSIMKLQSNKTKT